MGELEVFVPVGFGPGLGVDDLEFVTGGDDELGACFGTDTDPVDPCRYGEGPVRLDGDLESVGVEGIAQRRVELEERFATGAHHERVTAVVGGRCRPQVGDVAGEVVRRGERTPTGAVDTDEVGVAELADGTGSARLVAVPQVAAAESAEHRHPTAVGALALKGGKRLFHPVGHGRVLA